MEKMWPKGKELNKYTALFLTTILNLEEHKYSYGRIRNLRELKKEKIFLPIDKNKEIDWKYMESEMKNLHKRIINNFKLKLLKIHYKRI